MKKLKRLLALVIAMAMVVAMVLPVWADGNTPQDADKGSITVKSPIMGAQYTGYRIFDLTMSDSGDSIAYTIDTDSPFYNAVVAYAEATKETETSSEGIVDKYALTLTQITTVKKDTDPNYKKFNISVNTDDTKGPVFDAQHFGQYIQKAINGGDATADPQIPAVDASKLVAPIVITPDYSDTTANKVTLKDTDQITFKNTELGYYLITSKYPEEERTAEFVMPDGTTKKTLTKDTTDAEIEANANEYVQQKVTDAFVDTYITENKLKDNLVPKGRELTAEEKASVKKQLESSYKQSAIDEQRKALEKIKANASDINVKEPVLVFVDSTVKSAEIIEKNEQDKWDVPVNPDGSAELKDLPEHGEPDGGKNIIVGYKEEEVDDGNGGTKTVKKPIYADWTEANIGDTIHYELRVNAMNFVREDADLTDEQKPVDNNSEFEVKQVKEYILGDYQDDSLKFRPGTDKITVKVIDDNGNVLDTRDADNNVVANSKEEWDYSANYKAFFLTDEQALKNGAVKEDILENGGGIVIPWVKEAANEEQAKKHKNYTVTTEVLDTFVEAADDAPTGTFVVGEDGKKYVIDANGQKVHETKDHYWYSIYDSDVTIVVEYSMQLTDKATIDLPGNVNYSEYGLNFIKDDTYEYTPGKENPPGEENKPDKDSKKDTATVVTYALAIQKVDENNNKLAGATFKIQGLTAEKLDEGYYKVEEYLGNKVKDADGKPTSEDTADSVELVADKNGLLVIEGFTASAELIVKEIQAPDGYNLLTKPVTMKATKVGEEVVTTATTYYYESEEAKKAGTASGKEETNTSEKIYYNGENRIGKAVTVGSGADAKTTYYGPTDATIYQTKEEFENAVKVATNFNDDEVTSAKLTPHAVYVENKKGTELPSTGGIGTTIFYVVGAILVIGAGVVLITKRRMDA